MPPDVLEQGNYSKSPPFVDDGKLRTVYGLADPETGDVKYIGCTRDLDKRIKQHISQRSGNDHAHYEWMRDLAERSLTPFVVRFGVFPQAIAFGIERALVETLAQAGGIRNTQHARKWLGARGEPQGNEAVRQLLIAALQKLDQPE